MSHRLLAVYAALSALLAAGLLAWGLAQPSRVLHTKPVDCPKGAYYSVDHGRCVGLVEFDQPNSG